MTDQLTRALVTQAQVVNHDGRTDFHLRLDPPQLGSMQIHLTAKDHTISARVIVAQEGTRQLVEGQAQHLRQSLADAGLTLGTFDVSRGGSGGASNGGRQQPPELPTPTPFPTASAAAPRAVVKPTPIVPTDGIDFLA